MVAGTILSKNGYPLGYPARLPLIARLDNERQQKACGISLSALPTSLRPQTAMQNEAGDDVEMYMPRKCSMTNKIITSKDHAAVQINVGHVDEDG